MYERKKASLLFTTAFFLSLSYISLHGEGFLRENPLALLSRAVSKNNFGEFGGVKTVGAQMSHC